MSNKVFLSGLLVVLLGVLAVSCPNGFIQSWYDDAGAARAGGPDSCDILLFHFTEPAAIGVAGGGSGSTGDRALISITYPAGTGIPGDDKIKIFHNGVSVEAEGDWEAGVRDYTVTAANGARKYYRVTATESAQPPLPDTCDLILYYFTNPDTGALLSVGEIDTEGGASGGVADPVPVTIVYPEGTSFPLNEGDIHIYHNGADASPLGDWSYSGGSFVRLYRVTAAGGAAEKYYRVTATKGSPASAVLSDTRDILLYYFTDPASVGIPDPGDPLKLIITYPSGTSIPTDDDAIKIVHNGAAVKAEDMWKDGVRDYTVTAGTGATKTYQVIAEMAEGPPAPGILLYYFRAPGTTPPVLLSEGSNGKLILEGRSGTTKEDAFFIDISYPAEGFPAEEDIIYLASGEPDWDETWEIEGDLKVRGCVVTANGKSLYYQVRAAAEQAQAVPVTGVSIMREDKPAETLVLVPGGTATLTAVVKPDNATNKAVLWSSSNTAVATVKDGGVVTAHAVGNAAIIVTTADGGHTAVCVVTVSIPVTGIHISDPPGDSPKKITIAVGESAILKAVVEPDGADQTVTWESDDPTIATVDGKTGLVTGKAEGNVTIIAASGADPKKTAVCEVTVTPRVTGVIIRQGLDPIETLKLEPGEGKTLNALVTQDGASQEVTWTSSDGSIVTVGADGVVTAGSELGMAVITATTVVGGYKATCIVTVGVRVTGITLNHTSLVLDSKNTAGETLTATVWPDNATNQKLNWEDPSPAEIVTITGSGASRTVKPVAPGETVITVRTQDGDYTATCIVTVGVKVTSITLNSSSIILAPGDDFENLIATVTPKNATNQTLNWASSKPTVATVPSTTNMLDTNGKATTTVSAVAVGTTTITVSTQDGGYTATCTVIVRIQVGSVSIPATLELFAGESKALAPIIDPTNATITDVKWTIVSSNASGVVTVDGDGWINGNKNGWVTGVKTKSATEAGTATIRVTVKTVDGTETSNVCTVTVKKRLSSECEILAYDFLDPDSVGRIDESSGTSESPIVITITTPGATLANWGGYTSPVDEGHIHIKWIGALDESAPWVRGEDDEDKKGPLIRLYVVTAEDGTKKYYRVVAQPVLDIPDLATWNAAVAFVNALPEGTEIPNWNITGNFTLTGTSPSVDLHSSTITGTNRKVRLTTTKTSPHTISLGAKGSLIRTAAGQTFIIDGDITLQGKDGNDAALVYIDGGTVELKKGTINGNKATTGTGGGGVQVESSGKFTMTGGTVSGNETADSGTGSGGGVQVKSGGKFTMSAGTITGNTSASDGGGVQVESGGEFTMSGGDITANTVTADDGKGGGVWTAGTTTMSGGTIGGTSANTIGTSGTGGGVYVAGGSFSMSGSAAISGHQAAFGGGVYVASTGTFSMSGGTVGGASSLGNTAATSGGGVYVASSGTSTMSGGTIAGNKATSGGGGVYVAASGTFTMTQLSGKTTVIQGNKVTAGNGGGVYVASTGTSTMSGGTIAGNTVTTDGGGVYIESGTFSMSGGTIGGTTANTVGTSGTGGGVHVAGGSFSMSGSAAISGHQAASGGGVYVAAGTSTMSGGTIAENTATTDGGGVYVATSGTFTMGTSTSSATALISANTASTNGGGVYVASSGTFTMTQSSGTTAISGNTAANGGGVYDASTGTSTMSGGTIAGNTATADGGGAYIESGTFSMSGGTIGGVSTDGLGNTATGTASGGGGVYVASSGTFKMTSSSAYIRGNKAVNGGGVYNTGTFEMTNGTIGGTAAGYPNTAKSNTVSTYGGGVYNSKTFTMEGGTISGNTASVAGSNIGYGGGVYVASTGTFSMSNGTIGGTTASAANAATLGGGVHTAGGFTMDAGTISGNKANNSGGGVSVDSTGSFTMLGGTIGGTAADAANTAAQTGGGVYIENGTFAKTSGSGIIRNNSTSGGTASGLAVMLLKGEDQYYCDTTLAATDNISTANDQLPLLPGATNALNNWTKQY